MQEIFSSLPHERLSSQVIDYLRKFRELLWKKKLRNSKILIQTSNLKM